MLRKLALLGVVTVVMPGLALAAPVVGFVAGKDYTVLASPGPVQPGQIEVREFFWYGCPHCYKLDPHITQWLKTKPKDVVFLRTPAALNPQWEGNARGYYAVEMLGMTEQTHTPLFDTIHEKRQPIFTEDGLASFYAKYGVDTAKFHGLYNSFAVTGKVAQSKALAQKYQLDGVPAIVVNGKYVVKGEDAKVVAVTNYLIDKERAASKKK